MARAYNLSLDNGKSNHSPFHRQRPLRPPYDQALFLDHERIKFPRVGLAYWTICYPFDQVITYPARAHLTHQRTYLPTTRYHYTPVSIHTRSTVQCTLSDLKSGVHPPY